MDFEGIELGTEWNVALDYRSLLRWKYFPGGKFQRDLPSWQRHMELGWLLET